MSSTLKRYKTYYEFCAARYERDCSVNDARMLEFFQAVNFTRRVKKYIHPGTRFNGVIGIQPNPSSSDSRLDQDVDWNVSPGTDSVDRQINEALNTTREASSTISISVQKVPCDSTRAPDDGSDSDSDDDAISEAVVNQAKELMTNYVTSPVTEDAPIDKYGRKTVYVPVAPETVGCARKALIYLWKEQRSRIALEPNPASNPRFDIPLKTAIDDYELKAKRTYDATSRFQYIREHLCLLARHHLLLRDEDIRNLNLSDIFNIQMRHHAPGSSLASGLVFCLSRGKTNKKGVKLYATAFRHKNFLRCTVAAFAFYMLERFQASVVA
ncbi:hypothetical protein BGZ65_010101 [Modicella reniformis]|uniref:Ndc10 domain-containing protein n=1 Tax=Modicella reniformis TaxID=1440133 RepID=A0A9P6LTV2_9FUNG|nr:hypothetical protein BGZ65_010101 [Modicella reniformis]